MTIYTDSQLAVLRDSTINNVDAASSVGVSEATVRRWRRKNGVVPAPRSVNGAVPLIAERGPTREQILEAEVRDLRKSSRKATKAEIHQERVLQAIEAAVQVAPPMLPRPRPAVHDCEVPHHRQILLLSDLHYGEEIDKAQMNGINEYNTAIAERRLARIVRSVRSFQEVRPAMTGLEVFILGDMSSGAIHKLEEINEIPAAEQFVRAGYLLGDLVADLAPYYPEVRCAGIVGNHPRPMEQPASANSHNSGDWISYHVAKAKTANIVNVYWEIPTGAQLVRTVAGLNFLLWHGDGVRSSMPGVPWGGVMRRWNELRATYAARGTLLDYVTVGHFHQANVVSNVLMNGSICGANAYSLKNFGGGQRPTQLLVTLDERKSRITDICYITP